MTGDREEEGGKMEGAETSGFIKNLYLTAEGSKSLSQNIQQQRGPQVVPQTTRDVEVPSASWPLVGIHSTRQVDQAALPRILTAKETGDRHPKFSRSVLSNQKSARREGGVGWVGRERRTQRGTGDCGRTHLSAPLHAIQTPGLSENPDDRISAEAGPALQGSPSRSLCSTPGRCRQETAQAGGRMGGGLQVGPKEVLCGHVRGGRNGDKFPENILGHVNVVVGDEQGFLDVLI